MRRQERPVKFSRPDLVQAALVTLVFLGIVGWMVDHSEWGWAGLALFFLFALYFFLLSFEK